MSKNTFVIATRSHALHLAELSRTKLTRLQGECEALQTRIGELEALAPTLPEKAAPAVRKPRVIEPGTVVKFAHGRGAKRKELVGTVIAQQETQVRIRVGEGFSEATYTVFVGAVSKGAVTEAFDGGGEPETEEQAQEGQESAAGESEVQAEGEAQADAPDAADALESGLLDDPLA